MLAVRDAEEKARLLTQASPAMRTVEVVADLVVGAALATVDTRNSVTFRLAAVAPAVRKMLDSPMADRGRWSKSLLTRLHRG